MQSRKFFIIFLIFTTIILLLSIILLILSMYNISRDKIQNIEDIEDIEEDIVVREENIELELKIPKLIIQTYYDKRKIPQKVKKNITTRIVKKPRT